MIRAQQLLQNAQECRLRGMRELIDGLVQSAQNNGMELYGVHVYRRGEEPVERRLRSDDRENLRSVSKTFVSVALGIAEAEGRLAPLGDPALKYYPELKKSAARAWSGSLLPSVDDDIGAPHIPGPPTVPVVVPDLAADFFATPSRMSLAATSAPPASAGPYVAANRALRAAAGASVRDYTDARGLRPARHLQSPEMGHLPLNHPVAESELLFLRTSELARFGRLLLDDGRHEGRQLFPAGYSRPRIAAESVATVNDPEDQEFRCGAPLQPRRLVRPRRWHVQHGGPLRPVLHRLPAP